MDDKGNVKISEEVVAVITGIAASEIKGVAGMGGNVATGWAEMISGKKNISKGIKVELLEDHASIDIHIIAMYGARIPEVAWEIQENVKKAVENMTGLVVDKVNIHIEGIHIEKDKKNPPKEDAVKE